MKKFKLIIFLFFPFIFFSQTENYYAGIEIGTKGMKTTILELLNLKKDTYSTVDSWTENYPFGAAISKDSKSLTEDLNKTILLIQNNFEKLNIQKAVPSKNIFIVISPGLVSTKNAKDFLKKIEKEIKIKPRVISTEDEIKLMMIGGIPFNTLEESVILDIGSENTKGGYLTKLKKANTYFFSPIKLKYGTVSLTKKIEEKSKKNEDENFKLKSNLNDSIKNVFGDVMNANELFQKRKNFFFTGGVVWGFIMLTKEYDNEEYKLFTLNEVKKYRQELTTNFSKFEKMKEKNSEINLLLKNYTQENLISGSNILINFMENIKNIDDKKVYFISSGHLAWLKFLILENVVGKFEIY